MHGQDPMVNSVNSKLLQVVVGPAILEFLHNT
jgi:hypothetical protein